MSVCLFVCLSAHLSVRPSVCQSDCPSSYLSVLLCPSVYLSVFLPIFQSVCPLSFGMSFCPSVVSSLHLSVFLSVLLSMCPAYYYLFFPSTTAALSILLWLYDYLADCERRWLYVGIYFCEYNCLFMCQFWESLSWAFFSQIHWTVNSLHVFSTWPAPRDISPLPRSSVNPDTPGERARIQSSRRIFTFHVNQVIICYLVEIYSRDFQVLNKKKYMWPKTFLCPCSDVHSGRWWRGIRLGRLDAVGNRKG